jgi:hypothetical protein
MAKAKKAVAIGRKRRHRTGAGFTIPSFADHFGLPVSQVRRAVRDGTIKTVSWAGLPRIPPAEAERVAKLWSLNGRKPKAPSPPNPIPPPAAATGSPLLDVVRWLRALADEIETLTHRGGSK